MSSLSHAVATQFLLSHLATAHGGAEAANVILRDIQPGAIVQVQGWPDTEAFVAERLGTALGLAVPMTPGQSAAGGDTRVMTLAFGRHLAVGHADLGQQLTDAFSAEDAAVTDLSHARAVIRLSGEKATDVLAKGLPIDTALAAFPIGGVAQSTIYHINITAHRTDETTFDLYVFRGFAVSFWEWITDAAEEFGPAVLAP